MQPLQGIIHGKIIELDQAPNFPDGQPAQVMLEAVSAQSTPGEGLRRAFGAWAEDEEELDEFLNWNRSQRKISRPIR
jgi:hypothetical protein